MTAYAPFPYQTKQLRRAAIAELEAIEDRRDEWANRPLGTYTPTDECAVEDRFTRREMLATHALESTARGYMDDPNVCRWRAMVREQVRMARLYGDSAKLPPSATRTEGERRRTMAAYYHGRVSRWLAGYRRAIADARPATSLQAAE